MLAPHTAPAPGPATPAATAELVYVYDPVCSWCWAFGPEVRSLHQQLSSRGVSLRVISGGMILPPNTKPALELQGFLADVLPQMEEYTGRNISPLFWQNIARSNTHVFNSLPGSIALSAVKRLAPELALEYASRMQAAQYELGLDIGSYTILESVAVQLGLDAGKFKAMYTNPETERQARQDFAFAQQMGIRGFPTLLLIKDGKRHMLTSGYKKSEELLNMAEILLGNK